MTHTFDVTLEITDFQDAYFILLRRKLGLCDEELIKKIVLEKVADCAAKEFKNKKLKKEITFDVEE
jgi:hypothetical protein